MVDTKIQFSIEDFARECEQRGFPLSLKQIDQFIHYANWLQEWNQKMNLTAISDFDSILLKHFLDCLELVPVLQRGMEKSKGSTHSKVLDFGTGAGFPGLVLKLAMPELSMTLCDSLRKRTDFLSFIVDQLNLTDVQVLHARTEEIAKLGDYRERFAYVLARAVARMPVLIEWAGPLVQVEGYFYAMKGPHPQSELLEANRIAERVGFLRFDVTPYELPLGAGDHTIVCAYKGRPTPRSFPRRPGEAQRNPIL
ncbi:16S rRNA (guanine(527)-N(7))-methyltransferase RsmG [Sulfoacidibacillus thermotolerans]|uniref:Ribosomal RNA small subunit methyltransferase G n=1 Tax=Sulfoacidibacillus thermotolerans TaxID=1765684 RepID=A0A2U3D6B6_SULT2|nr:16S rRNA (guanine(527)-N(7))-methyltransferase RsmG [Sulfoacidibacillus thermotolerans]PWI56814.1 16S rRNA (guanine(527)-N(7))-methyltransferase RsmG [Sulfoacidibacillus thermotolerans]